MHDFRVQKGVEPWLVQRDEAGVVEGDELLQKAPLIRAVAESPGQVLYDDAVDPPALHVLDHPLKVLPLQVGCAAGPVVDIGVHNLIQAVFKKTGEFIL